MFKLFQARLSKDKDKQANTSSNIFKGFSCCWVAKKAATQPYTESI